MYETNDLSVNWNAFVIIEPNNKYERYLERKTVFGFMSKQ